MTRAAVVWLWAALAAGQEPVRLTLAEAGSRRPPDFAPAYEGRPVLVKGQIATAPVRLHVSGYAHMGIQDATHGLVLEGPLNRFDGFRPGQWVEAAGTLGNRAGLPVLLANHLTVVGQSRPPVAVPVTLPQLLDFGVAGRFVAADLVVSQVGENAGGVYFVSGALDNPLKVFAPLPAANVNWGFNGLRVGDRVRVAGLASQYCPVPPYNKRFQLLLHSPAAVVRLHGAWTVPPWVVAIVALAALLTGLVLWRRELRHRRQRGVLGNVYELSEEIFSAASPADILRSISEPLPAVFDVTAVSLYLYNRHSKTLDPVPAGQGAPAPVSRGDARRGIDAGAVSCFRNHALLAIPDTARSPFAPETGDAGALRSMLLIPMFAQGESLGVLVMGHARRVRNFTSLEKLMAQHLANQIGVAIKLIEQRAIREQLSRTEKIAAVGRLITGVVNELQAPLASIASIAARGFATTASGILREIQSEATRASAIVNRLVAIDRPEQVDARPLDANRLLRSLMEFRDLEWKARGIQVRNYLRDGPLLIVGSQGQLEQVFLSLLVYAEQSLAEAPEKIISIGSNLLARRVLVEISYSSAAGGAGDPFAAAAGAHSGSLELSVCRSIIAGHEGEIRLAHARASESRFEIELPWSPADAEAVAAQPRGTRAPTRRMTALVMESDDRVQRQLLTLLGARAFRVIPVRSAEEGLDLTQRMRFDVALCSSRLPGLNWIELLRRTRAHVGAFVVMTDGFDPELTAASRNERYFVLAKPVQENQLDFVLDHLSDPEPTRAERAPA